MVCKLTISAAESPEVIQQQGVNKKSLGHVKNYPKLFSKSFDSFNASDTLTVSL